MKTKLHSAVVIRHSAFTALVTAFLGTAVVAHAACLKFDGTNDYVDLGASAPVLGTHFTQEAWIYPQFSDIELHGFIGNQTGSDYGTRSPFTYVFGQTKLHFGFGTVSESAGYNTTNVLQPYAWNHVAATFDGAVYRVYVNGQPVLSQPESRVPAPNPVRYIGRADNYFPGLIDEVRLWNVARTPAEIAGSWNRRLAGNETNLVAYYPMDEGAGTATADASGHGLTGTLTNGVLWNTAEDAVTPVAFTRPATLVTNTSALLNALVNTNGARTTKRFEFGAASTALAFDGVDDLVRIANFATGCPPRKSRWNSGSASIRPSSNPRSAWIRTLGPTASRPMCHGKTGWFIGTSGTLTPAAGFPTPRRIPSSAPGSTSPWWPAVRTVTWPFTATASSKPSRQARLAGRRMPVTSSSAGTSSATCFSTANWTNSASGTWPGVQPRSD